MNMENKYYVYRFKDKNDNILYVGRTHDLKQRFKNHQNLTDDIVTIEYIECSTETDMVIKEIYYINLYFNDDSKNIKDVYDRPNEWFNDEWIRYNNCVKDEKNKIKTRNYHSEIPDYDKIYTIKIIFYYEDSLTLYYTGGYDENGLPNVSENENEAVRFSSLETIRKLKDKFKKIINDLYPDLEYYEYDIKPGIYKEDEILHYLFNYYNYNKSRAKELYFEDQNLDIIQGACFAELSYSYDNEKEVTKLLQADGLNINDYTKELRKEIREIERKRTQLRKDPDWEDPIWTEEFAKPYIKNNYDPDKALEELFENRRNNNKNFTFELHRCFLPEGYYTKNIKE